jgi:hypothetical protein
MKLRWSIFAVAIAAGASLTAGLAACASDETLGTNEPPSSETASSGGGADAALTEGDDACVDCEHFPAICSADALCLNGPFDPNDPTVGLDWRTQINVIRGRSIDDVWAAGAAGTLAHFDGTAWTVSDPGTRESMKALWLRDSAEISLVSLESIYARGLAVEADGGAPSDGGWTRRARPVGPPEYNPTGMIFASAWAANGADQLWSTAISIGEPADMTTGLWRLRLLPSGTLAVEGVVPVAECDLPLCASRCKELGCSELNSIHGISSDEMWAVGFDGAVVHITNAESAEPVIKPFNPQTFNALFGVWMASASEGWAVGAQGTIRHYTGDALLWDVVLDVPTSEDLHAVWGSSSHDVWAVGDNAVVLHYDGERWSRVKIAGLKQRRPKLTTVWMPAPGHVWVGGQGVVLSLGGKP